MSIALVVSRGFGNKTGFLGTIKDAVTAGYTIGPEIVIPTSLFTIYSSVSKIEMNSSVKKISVKSNEYPIKVF